MAALVKPYCGMHEWRAKYGIGHALVTIAMTMGIKLDNDFVSIDIVSLVHQYVRNVEIIDAKQSMCYQCNYISTILKNYAM